MSLIAAAAAAGLVAVLVTLAVERWGGRVGGLLGSVPTTIVPHALGLFSLSVDRNSFRDALAMAPAGMLLNAGFLWLWRVLPARLSVGSERGRLVGTAGISLLAWGMAAGLVVSGGSWLRAHGRPLVAVAWLLTLLLAAAGIAACWREYPAPHGVKTVGARTLVARALLAAASIACAGLLAREAPLLAGMAGVFPAIFLTTMVSLWLAQGRAVPQGAVGPLMLGSTSVAVFALLAGGAMPQLGPWLGAALAWVSAVALVTVPALAWQWRRQRSSSRARSASGGSP